MRKIFNLTNALGTGFVFLFMFLLGQLGVQFEFLNVFEQVFDNYEITDLYYTQIRDEAEVPFEDDVVLVNIGNLPRRGIAAQINILNQYNPAVIGVDIRFPDLKEDSLGDLILADAMRNTEHFIIGSEPLNIKAPITPDTRVFDTILKSPNLFMEAVATTAHVSTGEPNRSFVTWREFPVYVEDRAGERDYALAVECARYFDSTATAKFLARDIFSEDIYFKGDNSKYVKLDIEDLFEENFSSDLIEGKIVLMGYMGDNSYTDYHFSADKFYTPLNESIGRGYPDMYGVVVHANIISMILDGKFITEMPKYMSVIVAILLCYFNVALFHYFLTHHRLAIWYNALSKGIQLLEAILVSVGSIFIFDLFLYQANLTLALFVIILSGDLTEIYIDVIQNGVTRVFNKK